MTHEFTRIFTDRERCTDYTELLTEQDIQWTERVDYSNGNIIITWTEDIVDDVDDVDEDDFDLVEDIEDEDGEVDTINAERTEE